MNRTCFVIGKTILLILFLFQTLTWTAANVAAADSDVPAVTILSPTITDILGAKDNFFQLGETVTISAGASFSGNVVKMVILDNGVALKSFGDGAENTNIPNISYDWTNASTGEHTILVRAYAKVNGSTVYGTAQTNISVAAAASNAPVVTILSPAMADTFGVKDNVFMSGQTVAISAEASSSEGIKKIVIMDSETALKTFTYTEPYSETATISWDWTSASTGEHKITVKAYSATTALGTDWTYIVMDTGLGEVGDTYIGGSAAPIDGAFNGYTNTTGQVLPAGWAGDTQYANGGRISAVAAVGKDGSSCVSIAATNSAKDIAPYIQADNLSGLSGTLVFEMDMKRVADSSSADFPTVLYGGISGGTPSQILFMMKQGKFSAAAKGGVYKGFGSYEKNQWYNVKMVVYVSSGLMDLYLDGVKVESGVEMRIAPSNLSSLRISQLSTNATGTTYVDNIKLYKLEESGPSVIDVKLTDGTGCKVGPSLYAPLGTAKIALRFSDTVKAASCAAAVSLKSDSGTTVPFSGSYQSSDNSYTLTLSQTLSPKTKYILECGTELTGTDDTPMRYKRVWVFTTEASAYKIHGPRFFSGDQEILSLAEVTANMLHITASISQNKSASSVVTAAGAAYQNGRMTGVAVQEKTVSASAGTDFALDLSFTGTAADTVIKFFVWENDTNLVYSETLTANRGVPMIRSGFGNTTLSTTNSKLWTLSGADAALPAPNDWAAVTSGGTVSSVYINTEEGTTTERRPSIVSSPTNAADKVLYFLQNEVATATKARVELDFYLNGGVREVHFKERVFLHSDFNKLLSYPDEIDWMSFFEFWNENGWSDRIFPYRLTIGLRKPTGTATGFYFNATAQKAKSGNFVDVWSEEPHSLNVPVGKWMTWEVWYREGDANTGRLIFAVTPDGEARQIVFNVNNWTYAPGNPNPKGLPIMHPMKMYTSKETANYLHDHSGALQIYWDDFELYKDGR